MELRHYANRRNSEAVASGSGVFRGSACMGGTWEDGGARRQVLAGEGGMRL